MLLSLPRLETTQNLPERPPSLEKGTRGLGTESRMGKGRKFEWRTRQFSRQGMCCVLVAVPRTGEGLTCILCFSGLIAWLASALTKRLGQRGRSCAHECVKSAQLGAGGAQAECPQNLSVYFSFTRSVRLDIVPYTEYLCRIELVSNRPAPKTTLEGAP